VNILEADGLWASYRGSPVLSGIELSLKAGELAVLMGPNGSGKTTLLKTLGGLLPLRDRKGRIMIKGKNIGDFSRRERASLLGFLFQDPVPAWPFTVQELIAQGRFFRQGWFGAENTGDRLAVAQALATAGLSGFEERPVTELSGGEYQRVLIARAAAQEASCLLLDEPAAKLDLKYQYMMMDLLKSLARDQGKAILMSLHELNLAAAYADRIILLSRGRIAAQGSPEETLDEDTLRRVFELPESVPLGLNEAPRRRPLPPEGRFPDAKPRCE
jgi:iron complex transport system ATP-binding protein